MQKHYFAYVRVSTARQGEHGVSLEQQRAAIESFANHNNITVETWFEERQTAAKQGRPVFNRMLAALRAGEARGVIMHKIDRSARNLRDWAAVGELIDSGVEVYFATESLDLSSRGGRLSADIQAVVAADYIRNLREETRKGFYGRLKQGVYPRPAPIGYLDQGQGKPKLPDPDRASLVRLAFELYASGRYNLRSLTKKMHDMGLRSRTGRRVSLSGLAKTLNNPFYIGLIRIQKTGEVYQGAHDPIIPKQLFDRVRDVLAGKVSVRTKRHSFVFSRSFVCKKCSYSLIGELQKGRVYYRCHSPHCRSAIIREDEANLQIQALLESMRFDETEARYLSVAFNDFQTKLEQDDREISRQMQTAEAAITDRLHRLTDAYLDGNIEPEIYHDRKAQFLMERQKFREPHTTSDRAMPVIDQVSKFLELAKTAHLLYKSGEWQEKRELLLSITSNRVLNGKNLEFTLETPFRLIAEREKVKDGSPPQDVHRTAICLIKSLFTAAAKLGISQ